MTTEYMDLIKRKVSKLTFQRLTQISLINTNMVNYDNLCKYRTLEYE